MVQNPLLLRIHIQLGSLTSEGIKGREEERTSCQMLEETARDAQRRLENVRVGVTNVDIGQTAPFLLFPKTGTRRADTRRPLAQ